MLVISICWLFDMLIIWYANYFDTLTILICCLFVMYISWYDIYLLCYLFDMSFVCYAIYLICHLFVMLYICYAVCLLCPIFGMLIYLIWHLFVMLDICYACCSFFLLHCETLWYALVNLFVIQLVDVFSGMLVLFMVGSYLTLFLYSIPHINSCYMNVIYKYTNLKYKLMSNFDGVLLQICTENKHQIEHTHI